MDIRKYLFSWKLDDDFINRIETLAIWSGDPRIRTGGRNGLFVTKNNEVYAVGNLINNCFVHTSPDKDETKGLFEPVFLKPLSNQRIKKFAITYDHVFMCTEEGSVWGYGHFKYRDDEGYNLPSRVSQLDDKRVIDIAVAPFENAVLALTDDGQIHHWVLLQSKQQVREITFETWHSIPISVFSGSKLASFYAVLQNGKVVRVSRNRQDMMHFQDPTDEKQCEIVKMACGFVHALLLSSDGRLFAIGCNVNGQLGLGENKSNAVKIEQNPFFTEKVIDIAATPSCPLSAVMTESRRVYMFGICRGVPIFKPTLTSCTSLQEVFFLYSIPLVTFEPMKITDSSLAAHEPVKVERANGIQPMDSLLKTKKALNFLNNGSENGLSDSAISIDKLCDFVIVVEGVSIPVHKTVLALRCEHFAEMFRQNTAEVTPSILEIGEGDIKSYRSFLKYIYTDQIDKNLSTDEIAGLFNLATKYRVKPLAEHCSIAMMQPNITIDNVISSYESVAVINQDSSTKHISEKLKELCLAFAVENEKAVFLSEAFQNMKPDSMKKFVMEVVQHRSSNT